MAKKQPPEKDGIKVVGRNRKAAHEYLKQETFEAGMVLKGTEVKSLRDGKVNFADSFVLVKDGEAFLHKLDIPEFTHGNRLNHTPQRIRKLLLHKREIIKLHQKVREKGLTLVPWSVYFKNGIAKVEIALVKGKKLHDKRDALAKKDAKREMDRATFRRR